MLSIRKLNPKIKKISDPMGKIVSMFDYDKVLEQRKREKIIKEILKIRKILEKLKIKFIRIV